MGIGSHYFSIFWRTSIIVECLRQRKLKVTRQFRSSKQEFSIMLRFDSGNKRIQFIGWLWPLAFRLYVARTFTMLAAM
jgi:hypothetical protein